jgi:hypothetical protein
MAKTSGGMVVTLVVIAIVAVLGVALYWFGFDMIREMHGGRGLHGGL